MTARELDDMTHFKLKPHHFLPKLYDKLVIQMFPEWFSYLSSTPQGILHFRPHTSDDQRNVAKRLYEGGSDGSSPEI